MKIEKIETLFVDRYLFVKVYTDTGVVGLGESGAWGYLEASAEAVKTFARYLIGKDPLRRAHHWEYLYRYSHFRGAAIMGALSAVDIALWDIAGKHFDVPCYELFGGKMRDKARVYVHVHGDTKERLYEGCRQAKRRGYTAVGHLTPFLDSDKGTPYFQTHVDRMRDGIETVGAYRDIVGRDVDLCIELHRRLTPAEAIALGRGIEKYHPFFFEDPIRPDRLDEMALVQRETPVPVATGERIHTIFEFASLLERRAMRYARISVCLAGGLTHAKKIAALAEAYHVAVVPHNPLSAVSTAACLQLDAAVPNFALQELTTGQAVAMAPTDEDDAWYDPGPGTLAMDILKEPLKIEDGYLLLPERPGIGVELTENAAELYPYRPRAVRTQLHVDGSVVDQ